MANQSNWKGLESDVAKALGGIRRLRTTESYGEKADDVLFPKKPRKSHKEKYKHVIRTVKNYPCLKRVAVECKKRKRVTFTNDFVISRLKYCLGNDKNLVFVSKLPATLNWKKRRRRFRKVLKMSIADAKKHIKRSSMIGTLVTVDLLFFKELWEAWLEKNEKVFPPEG